VNEEFSSVVIYRDVDGDKKRPCREVPYPGRAKIEKTYNVLGLP
jgi:hypothetical protein